MADLNELKPVGKLNPFAKFCCTIGNLPTSYMISLTYEEQLLWLCKYLEDTVIPAVNTNAEAVQELQELYVVLKNYVDNYFENLDVQNEINNKLDEMVTDGTLTQLIGNYVNPIIEDFEDTVNDQLQQQNVRIANLESGSPIFVGSTSEMIDTSQIYVLTTNMHIYYYNGSNWIDSTVVYGNASDDISGYPEIINTAQKWNSFNNDFNNLVGNKIYICAQPASVGNNLQNAPYQNFNGNIISYNYRSSDTLGLCQLAYAPSQGLYVRVCWAGTWRDWRHYLDSSYIPDNILSGYGQLIDTVEKWSVFNNDFNNFAQNKIYTIGASYSIGVTPANAPFEGNVNGTLLSFNYHSAGNNNGQVQLFITQESKIYYRIKWSNNWLNWISLSSIKEELNFNELYKSFDTVGIIGDSLASGECAYKDGETIRYIDMYEKSWGQFMARDSGNTYYNFSKGGLNTRTWFTTQQGYPTASDGNHKCKAYIIGLGVNDRRIENYIGSSADIDLNNYENNADTFYGNYAKIIQTMKIQQPKAKFFLFTIPSTNSAYDDFNTAIRYMATIFDNVYIIDLRNNHLNDYIGNSFINNNLRSGHYNAITYQYMSKLIEQWISKYMYDNYSEFEQVEFIGTNYEWTE